MNVLDWLKKKANKRESKLRKQRKEIEGEEREL
jgi:hypothetical protein